MSRQSQQGFVLVVVLWSMAALALITGGIMARINSTLEQSHRMREIARVEQQTLATEQTLLYLLSAGRWNAGGMDLAAPSGPGEPENPFDQTRSGPIETPTLRFDGSVYPGVGEASFQLQDMGGKFGLAEPKAGVWRGMMRQLDVPDRLANRWLDQLNDYQDQDGFSRLNGAEAQDYRALGLAEPPNRFMVSPYELLNLPFAREHPDLTWKLIDVAAAGISGIQANFNTSPAEVLSQVADLTASESGNWVAQRPGRVYNRLADVGEQTGTLLGSGVFSTSWSIASRVEITLAGPQGRQKHRIAVDFNPNADGRPWVIDYYHPARSDRQQFDQEAQESTTADALNPRSTNDTAHSATDWSLYPTFFPRQLSLD